MKRGNNGFMFYVLVCLFFCSLLFAFSWIRLPGFRWSPNGFRAFFGVEIGIFLFVLTLLFPFLVFVLFFFIILVIEQRFT